MSTFMRETSQGLVNWLTIERKYIGSFSINVSHESADAILFEIASKTRDEICLRD